MFLVLAFFFTALLYACVGFGGGSTYNALLSLNSIDYRVIPILSLVCNVIVVTGGVWHFSREKHMQISRMLPWVTWSIPASFLGGLIPVPEIIFTGILSFALLFSAVRLLYPDGSANTSNASLNSQCQIMPAMLGFSLGLVSGLTGIGGGIFLAPILHFLKWGNAKQIAGASALFILVNSLAGLFGQGVKIQNQGLFYLALSHMDLLLAVLLGGQIGSWLGSARMNTTFVKKMTGLLILYVSVRLMIKFFSMFA